MSTAPVASSDFRDRWNPVLVKELRAALRGRYFRVLFPITLFVATAVAVVQLVDGMEYRRDVAGRELFQGMFVCLSLAVNALVPFSAFMSVGHEWEEHTFDLLVLSKLRPSQIVFGKLLAAGIEALLYASAFTPFLVFAFLLRGIGIETIALLVAGTLVSSASCSMVAAALSSLSRARAVRVVLLVLLAGFLLAANAASFAFVDDYLRHPHRIDSVEAFVVAATTFVAMAIPGVLGLGIATSSLTHAEENSSTVPRVVVTVVLVVIGGLLVALFALKPSGDVPQIFGALLTIGVTLCDMFFATEPERMTLRAREQLPRSKLGALLTFPFFPGGARGVVLHLLHLAIVLAVVACFDLVSPTSGAWTPRSGGAVGDIAIFQAYFFVYVALPTLIASRASVRGAVRLATRVLIPVCALFSMFLPALVGFLVEQREWTEMRHLLDPFWIAFGNLTRHSTLYLAVGTGAAIVLALNGRRLARAFAETLDASAQRRASGAPRG